MSRGEGPQTGDSPADQERAGRAGWPGLGWQLAGIAVSRATAGLVLALAMVFLRGPGSRALLAVVLTVLWCAGQTVAARLDLRGRWHQLRPSRGPAWLGAGVTVLDAAILWAFARWASGLDAAWTDYPGAFVVQVASMLAVGCAAVRLVTDARLRRLPHLLAVVVVLGVAAWAYRWHVVPTMPPAWLPEQALTALGAVAVMATLWQGAVWVAHRARWPAAEDG